MAGLRHGPDQGRAYAETKSGAFIYHGGPASFHDWEFRTLLRVELLEAQEAALKKASQVPDGASVEEEFPTTKAPSASQGTMGPKPYKPRDTEADIAKERYTLVAKVIEGLKGDSFLVARDMGTVNLVGDDGLRSLIAKIRSSVFPRSSEESKELSIGQVRGGMMARQSNESETSGPLHTTLRRDEG